MFRTVSWTSRLAGTHSLLSNVSEDLRTKSFAVFSGVSSSGFRFAKYTMIFIKYIFYNFTSWLLSLLKQKSEKEYLGLSTYYFYEPNVFLIFFCFFLDFKVILILILEFMFLFNLDSSIYLVFLSILWICAVVQLFVVFREKV